ncbi:MAG: hypothetical protein ACO3EW_04840 [Candidatus Nanopelagicaceae bacterium]
MALFKIMSPTTAGTHVTAYRTLAGFARIKGKEEKGGPEVVTALRELLHNWAHEAGEVVTMSALRDKTWTDAHRMVKAAVFRGINDRLASAERRKTGSINLFDNVACFVAYVLEVQARLVKEGKLKRLEAVKAGGTRAGVVSAAGEVEVLAGGWKPVVVARHREVYDQGMWVIDVSDESEVSCLCRIALCVVTFCLYRTPQSGQKG